MYPPQPDPSTQQLLLEVRRREQRRRRRRIAVLAVVAVLVVGSVALLGLRALLSEPSPPVIAADTTPSVPTSTSTTQVAVVAPSTSTTASTTTTSAVTTTTSSSTTTTSLAETTTSTTAAPAPRPVLPFDTSRAMAHIKKFAKEIGVRRGGTSEETEAARYALAYLNDLGYRATLKDVPIPNGLTSHDVIAVKQGSSPLTLVIGGHMDSKKPAPGANDNASGSAAVLELARDVADADIVPTVVFVLFGNEEMIDKDSNHHHYGSRAYVSDMTAEQRANLVAMISLDMVGYGGTFTVRTMGKGPTELRTMLQDFAKESGLTLKYVKDTGSSGMSDHEPFELAGYPAVWLEWREDPVYHTVDDTYEHVNSKRLGATGEFVLSFIAQLDQADLERLRAAVR